MQLKLEAMEGQFQPMYFPEHIWKTKRQDL